MMALVSNEENAALSNASGNAAIEQALALLNTDREAIRAANWNRRNTGPRRIAMLAAGLPKERAEDALKTFNAFERGQVNLAVRRLIKELEIIALAMQGGECPDASGGDRGHQIDGIASIGRVQ